MHKERKGVYQLIMWAKRKLHAITVDQWMRLALLNLLLVSILGFLMRLKMILPLPALNQKFLLHAHSHFAFSGWVTHALMVLTAYLIIQGQQRPILSFRYQGILLLNLIAGYGMLLGFLIQGYDTVSIFFSSLGVVASYIFAWVGWRDMNRSPQLTTSFPWLKAALTFLVISSIGTFLLAWIMTNNIQNPRAQLAAIYFYLHFQYNGWFFFSCMALFIHWLHKERPEISFSKNFFRVFLFGCPIGYLLSILWWKMPLWLFVILILTVLAQTAAWGYWLQKCWQLRTFFQSRWSPLVRGVFLCVLLAATIKFLLQGLSVIPSLSKLSYSFRPIVIGYIHLVLLGIISLFILAYGSLNQFYRTNKMFQRFVILFIVGVVANELILMLQGISGIIRTPIPSLPDALAVAAGIMVVSLAGIYVSQILASPKPKESRTFP